MDNLHDRHRYNPLGDGRPTTSSRRIFGIWTERRNPLTIGCLVGLTFLLTVLFQVMKSRQWLVEHPIFPATTSVPRAVSGRGSPPSSNGTVSDGAERGPDSMPSARPLSREYWHHTRARLECGGCPSQLLCAVNLVLTDAPQNVSLLSAGFALYPTDDAISSVHTAIDLDSQMQKVILESVAHNIGQLVSKLIDAIVPNLDSSLTCLDSLNASAIADTILKAARIVVDECIHVTNVCMKEFLISHC